MADTEKHEGLPDDGTDSHWRTEPVSDTDLAPEGSEHDCAGEDDETDE